jgi:hypothetical protein
MRRLIYFCFAVLLGGWLVSPVRGQNYMTFEFDGQSVMGRPVAFKDSHIQIALQSGGYTNVPWGRLSQNTLHGIMRLKLTPNYYAAFAAPFLDVEPKEPPQGPKVTIRPVERMERPISGGLLASPVMWLIFLLIYVANIYAGYEISIYRQRNPGMVCGLSALAPVLAPILFLSLPSVVAEEAVAEATSEEGEQAAEASAETTAAPEAETAAAEAAEAAPEHPVTVYQRGQFTFNRRFFETKLAGFLRVVPGEAEKDMVIAIVSARGNHVGPRLTRVSPNDLTLLVVKGAASQEVIIPFGEISEVKIRHKDDE